MAITNLSNYEKDSEFLYMLLSRLQMDCEFYLGAGNRLTKYLWALNVDLHINEMIDIYNYLGEKPEWLTIGQINEYKKQMTSK